MWDCRFNGGAGNAVAARRRAQPVRDLWQRRDLTPFTEEFSAEVERHGVVFIKVGAAAGE